MATTDANTDTVRADLTAVMNANTTARDLALGQNGMVMFVGFRRPDHGRSCLREPSSIGAGGGRPRISEMVAVRAQIARLVAAMAALPTLCLALTACGTPVSVSRLDARTVQTELTSNSVTTGKLSELTQIVLRHLDLVSVYAYRPPSAIAAVNQIAIADTGNRDLLFALAEMTFLEAERTDDRSYFLATVVYAYAFLFPTLPADRPNPFDPRLRAAADLYNLALTAWVRHG